MSSCCLAACGRLTENSQSGKAGFNSLWTGSPGTSAPNVAAAARRALPPARGQGFGRGRGSAVWLQQGFFCHLPFPTRCVPATRCRGKRHRTPSPPFAILKPFHPLTSVHPCSSGTGRSFPLDQRLQDRTKGPASLSPVVVFPFPLLWTCILFPTLPKIIAIKVWCLEAVSCLQGGAGPRPPTSPHHGETCLSPSLIRFSFGLAVWVSSRARARQRCWACAELWLAAVAEGSCSQGSAMSASAARGRHVGLGSAPEQGGLSQEPSNEITRSTALCGLVGPSTVTVPRRSC